MGDLALPYVMPRIRDPDLEFAKYHNALRAFRQRRRRDIRLGATPIDLTIDMTTVCQLHCPHCATGFGSLRRDKLVMKTAMYDTLLRGLGDGCFAISYFSNGEPILNRNLAPLLSRTRHQEIFSAISTNLSIKMSEEKLTDIIKCGLGMIIVSLDGATPETYQQYRRGGDFDLVVDNMRRLISLKKKLRLTYPLIEWRFLRFKHNEHEEKQVRALAKAWRVDLLEFWPGAAPREGSVRHRGVFAATAPLRGAPLSGPALGRLMKQQARERILARLVPEWTAGANVGHTQVTPKCDWLYFSGMAYPDGRLGPCCVLSNADTDFVDSVARYPSVADAFNSDKHVASRRMFVTGERAGTACDRCPSPTAQYYQFRAKVRAILRNAPDWAVKVMAADPDSFFFSEDRVLAPEVEVLFSSPRLAKGAREPGILARLRGFADRDSAEFADLLSGGQRSNLAAAAQV
jgi:pyruvate-formate lyase-activating enzyme